MCPHSELPREGWEPAPGNSQSETCFSLLLFGHICVVVVVEVRGSRSGRTVGLLQVLPLHLVVVEGHLDNLRTTWTTYCMIYAAGLLADGIRHLPGKGKDLQEATTSAPSREGDPRSQDSFLGLALALLPTL